MHDPAEDTGRQLAEFATADLTFQCGEGNLPYPDWPVVRNVLGKMLRVWLAEIHGVVGTDGDDYVEALLDTHPSVAQMYEQARSEFADGNTAAQFNGHLGPVDLGLEVPEEILVTEVGDNLRETYEECTDGGGDEHFAALATMGQCPYCGMMARR